MVLRIYHNVLGTLSLPDVFARRAMSGLMISVSDIVFVGVSLNVIIINSFKTTINKYILLMIGLPIVNT